MPPPATSSVPRSTASRRGFLKLGAGAGAGLLAPVAAATPASDAPLEIPPWSTAPGEPVGWHPYGQPSDFERDVIRRSRRATPLPGANSSMTPLHALFGTITPTGLVFERHHAGIPMIDPARHRLAVHGRVERPLLLSMEDLVRFPSVTRTYFLECSGNTGSEWRGPGTQSVQMSHGLLSCCEWTGVPLSVVLQEAGVQPGAAWVLAEGADAAGMSRSVPLAKALDDALLVYAQNGERLRPESGYPLRLFLPGWEGNMSVKWLRRLKVGDAPFMSREETSKYTDLLPDGTARQFSFAMEAKSVITFPAPEHRLRGAGFYEISGLAWSGRGRVARVEVSVDGGATWRDAALQAPVLDRSLTRFRLPWTWDGAPAVLQSRVWDETGYRQPTPQALVAARGLESNYHFNAIQSWGVAPDGKVRNVRV